MRVSMMRTNSPRSAPKRSRSPIASLGRPGRGTRKDRTTESERSAVELRALQGFRMIFGSARRFDADVRRTPAFPGRYCGRCLNRPHGEHERHALAERMALHQTTASNIVNGLVERKLIRRTRNAVDQRVVHLFIAAQGMRVLRRAPGPHMGLLVDALKGLDAGELARLQKGLAALVTQMRRAATIAAGETLLGE